ncbi:hypothetical protein [Pleomorphovibrio marinus]|uniref:hypothetical protein n=1 Tax=Pleomorphovibrio marinus TaxID=2164132 RepID=UPI000E0B083E|nr:hypothetical protein [Pleomorphovibrio marinus]
MKAYLPIQFEKGLIIMMALLFTWYVGYPQERNGLIHIQTKDGNEYVGEVIEEDEVKIKVLTQQLGEITIFKSEIRSRRELSEQQLINGQFWSENLQATRYFWLPNGYGLKRGEAYYQNAWIFFNQASVGLTDNFSIGAGTVPLFLFGGAATPFWITPKFSVPVVENKVNIGVGALVGTVIGENEGGFGLLYGVSTFGSKDKNFSIGMGWGFAGGEIASSPTISFGGMVRTGPKGYFMTENYLISAGGSTLGLLSAGGRRILGRVSLDYGLILPLGADIGVFIALPWLGINVPIGN